MYLFIGEDELAKQEKIQAIKKQLIPPEVSSFNYEVFTAKELSLPLLKEALCRLPVSSKHRLLVIKDAFRLKDELQEYLLSQIKNLTAGLTIILNAGKAPQGNDSFLKEISKIAKVISFKSPARINAFGLGRAIEQRQPDEALRILADLFKAGEKAERIVGALRYQFVKRSLSLEAKRKRIGLLLETDIGLKTGRLKPELALETLIVKLCS